MQCPVCSSVNVEHLPHYWQSLPKESPLRVEYAPPEVPGASYWWALAAVVVGIVVASSGAVLAGLLAAAVGLVWGVLVRRGVAAAEAGLADWNSSRVCLACTGMF